MRLKVNTILLVDAYKFVHWLQLPDGTTKIYGYVESRGTKLRIKYQRLFGLQGFIKDYLEGVVIEQWMIEEAEELLGEVFGTNEYFNKAGFQRIIDVHGGKLPIRIRAVEEGLPINLKNVMVTVENLDDELPWLTQWVETMLLRAVWYQTGVATISSAVMDLQRRFAAICGCSLNPFFLNDFGARGVSSHESAEIGGSAHLINFLGTDTVEAIRWAKNRYGKTATGYSVFASEHSTTTIYGKVGELNAYTNFLTRAPKDKVVSIVIDSYNTERAVKVLLGEKLKNVIMERTAPTVFRPDSGDPIEMSLKVVTWLWEIFGGKVNDKGFKILDPHVKVIYGDGINLESIEHICENLIDHKFSIENIIFGMGGKLLQSSVDRDTFQYANKACWGVVNGVEVEIYKDPVTDSGKKSKRGRLKLVRVDKTQYETVKQGERMWCVDELKTVFENGELIREMTFEEVRKNAAIPYQD